MCLQLKTYERCYGHAQHLIIQTCHLNKHMQTEQSEGAPWPQGTLMTHERLPSVSVSANVALLVG